MKHINKILLAIITIILFIPNLVSAASANFSVSAPSQGVVGNQLTVTVTISSSTSLGSWELALNYDKSYLQLSSAPEGANGTHVAGNASSSGIKSKSYTYKFKVLKSGTTTISTTSTDAYGWNEETLSPSNGSKKIVLKTQAEIEASYSANAYLKSISVGDYSLSPEFNKETKEYEVEVENDVEIVNISATKEDANASISGTGEKTLVEGPNKFEIVCTAQKGNSITYVVTVNRKELNPIKININGKEYGIVRKKDMLPELVGFAESTVTYQDTEIPALYNETLDIYVIGVKDEEGNVYTYNYTNSSIGSRYIQLKTEELIIIPLSYEDNIFGYNKEEITISETYKLNGIKLSDKQYIINGRDILTGEVSTYIYDTETETFIPYDISLISETSKKNQLFFQSTIALGVVVVLLFILLILKKGDSKPKKENKKKPIIDEFKEIKVDEENDDIVLDEFKEKEEVEEKVSKKDLKKQAKEEKKRLKELEKQEKEKSEEEIKVKEIKEEPKKEEKVIDDEVDDPLNDEDDFMDFWETMEIKKIKK